MATTRLSGRFVRHEAEFRLSVPSPPGETPDSSLAAGLLAAETVSTVSDPFVRDDGAAFRSPCRVVHEGPPRPVLGPWSGRSVHECFGLRVGSFLDLSALVTDDAAMSYRQVVALSDQVAHAIYARLGRRPAAIALVLEHEAPVPAAMLGVLKAGGFIVPIDPSYPAARNRDILEDCGVDLVITNDRQAAIAAVFGIPADRILKLGDIVARNVPEFVGPAVGPDDLAFLIYTSGSTGRPKGVKRTHGNLLHYVTYTAGMGRVGPGARVALVFSYSFGAALGNVFTSLLNGATLLPFNVRAAEIRRFADWLAERRITLFHTVPTVFRHLTDALTVDHEFPHLQYIQLAGERMFASDLERFKAHFGRHTKLIVGFGTVECSHTFEFVADRHTECSTDALPIGYPIDRTDVLIVDGDGAQVGPHRVGEIVVRGPSVSPGYWRQPELTAERFRPDPKGGSGSSYFTGDLARMLPDGCVFFVGRTDERVKIHGQAVEVAEIEAALLHASRVARVAVVASGDPPKIVAYVAGLPDARPFEADVQRVARERLPAAMVPTVVVMDALPILPNGKIDRQALGRDAATRPQQKAYAAPATPVEVALAGFFGEALGLARVGLDDNFFEMGGHSLPALQVLARIEASFGMRLAPDVIIASPTVRELALRLTARGSPDGSSLLALRVQGSRPPFFWVHGEKSNLFLPRVLGPDQPLFGLVQQSLDGRPAYHRTLPEIAAYYRGAIESVQPNGPYYLGGFCVGGTIAFEIAQQLRRQGQQIRLLALVDPPHLTFPTKWHAPARLRRGFWRRVPRLVGFVETVGGVASRAVSRSKQQFVLAGEAARRIGHALRGTEHRVPPGRRPAYIEAIYRRAGRRYVPAVYPGRVVLLKTSASAYEPEKVWSRLAAGGVEVHELPGPHDEIVFEPRRIEQLGAELMKCLAESQRTPAHE